MGQSLRVGGSYVAVTILIPPTNPPLHLSRARALQRQQEGDQGERASRLGWERGEGGWGGGTATLVLLVAGENVQRGWGR